MRRGRPVKSQIRQNVLEILHYLGKGYGYQISKVYNEVFPRATQRVIYYHLKKGIQTREIMVHKIEQEQGNFSWGSVVEKKYYTLGTKANLRGDGRVEDFLKKWKR
ncbi:hypothetical protein HYT55_04545 [Candidatus Woesearchaeota archaeon]|nr:hypothetical protein [Candidatus Woesearchaeota archaeon]